MNDSLRSAALNKLSLKRLAVTHVVNCAHGESRYHVTTGPQFYGDEFRYYGIEATDVPSFDLTPHFRPAAKFIRDAILGIK